jgi:NitT/TauT family transport system substrate-binding protein
MHSIQHRHAAGVVISGALFAGLIAGCEVEPPAVLRVGMFVWPGYAPLQLANELGSVDKAQVRLVHYSSATQVLRAFRNGAIEAATLTLDEALLLADDLPDVRVVLVMDASHGADVVLGKPGLESLADLRGRRVGYEATALGAYMLSRALDVGGLRSDEISVVSLQIDEHERAFQTGRVDAVVTFEPTRSRLLARGARVLFDSSQIPGEILDVVVIHGRFLEQHPQGVRAMARGWFKALEFKTQRPDEAVKLLSQFLQLSVVDTVAAYQGVTLLGLTENRRLLGGDTPGLRPIGERLASVMEKKSLLKRSPDQSVLYDARGLD